MLRRYWLHALVAFAVLAAFTWWYVAERKWNAERDARLAKRVAAAITTNEARTGRSVGSLAELAPPFCDGPTTCLFESASNAAEYARGIEIVRMGEARSACARGQCAEIGKTVCRGSYCERVEPVGRQ